MKKLGLYLIVSAVGAVTLFTYPSCKKVPQGFLTNYPYYDQNPMYIGKGYAYTSSPLETIGSTIPMKMKILHIYEKSNGKLMDSVFLKRYPLDIFTGFYNPAIDSTLDMIKAIRTTIDTFPVNVNSANGSFQANFNTFYMPSGDYTFDLQITNVSGTKVYPNIGEFILHDTLPYSPPDLQYDKLYKVGDEAVSKLIDKPLVSVKRVADSPNMVIVKIIDKNSTPFDPKKGEIVKRPNPGGSGFLQTYDDYALSGYNTDTSMNFIYPFVPFPSQALSSLPNSGLLYYRIPTQFIHIDNLPDDTWSANPRFRSRYYVPGEYIMTVQLPDITHR